MSKVMPKNIDPESIIKTWSKAEMLAPGIVVYKNVIKNEFNIINRLENVLNSENNYKWRSATVGYGFKKPEYRNCLDFKFKKEDIRRQDKHSNELKNIWQNCYDSMSQAVLDYCYRYNLVELQYWEAMNFIKYDKGQHFEEHTDHGFSYNATVSLVAYINDDYEGGELYFRLQDLMYKPEAGDLIIFPSNFMYPHKAMQVTEGTKYSIVTILDYTDRGHVTISNFKDKASFSESN
jgi:predicted 2-oxoglutarate/Fe(II)-dependent dioxygenase YbiX